MLRVVARFRQALVMLAEQPSRKPAIAAVEDARRVLLSYAKQSERNR